MNNTPSLPDYTPLSQTFAQAVAGALDAAVDAYENSDLYATYADEWSHVLGEQLRHAQGRPVLDGSGSVRLFVPRTCTPLPLNATEPQGMFHMLPSLGVGIGSSTEVEALISVLISPDGYLDSWVVRYESGSPGEDKLDLSAVTWMTNVTFGTQAAVDIDDEWAKFVSSCIAGLPVAKTLVLGQSDDKSRYLLDNLADALDVNVTANDALVPVCVVGVITDAGDHAEPDFPDEVMEAASALLDATPGGLVLSGQGRDFALTVLLPAEDDMESADFVVEGAAQRAGLGVELVALGRIDVENATRTLIGSSERVGVVNAVGAVFFAAHGMDPTRLLGVADGDTCAFPDLHEACDMGFWYCAHEQFHEGNLAVALDYGPPVPSNLVEVSFYDADSGTTLFEAVSEYTGPFMVWDVRFDALDRPFFDNGFYAFTNEAFLALCVMFAAKTTIVTDEQAYRAIADTAERLVEQARSGYPGRGEENLRQPDEPIISVRELETAVYDALAAVPLKIEVKAHDLAIREYGIDSVPLPNITFQRRG